MLYIHDMYVSHIHVWVCYSIMAPKDVYPGAKMLIRSQVVNVHHK